MLEVMSEKQVSELKERVRQLYTSDWIQDNLTAILMDGSKGGHGLHEEIARVKAHRILNWLEFKKSQDELPAQIATPAPEDRP